jgi:hypothetical protein
LINGRGAVLRTIESSCGLRTLALRVCITLLMLPSRYTLESSDLHCYVQPSWGTILTCFRMVQRLSVHDRAGSWDLHAHMHSGLRGLHRMRQGRSKQNKEKPTKPMPIASVIEPAGLDSFGVRCHVDLYGRAPRLENEYQLSTSRNHVEALGVSTCVLGLGVFGQSASFAPLNRNRTLTTRPPNIRLNHTE